MTPPDSSPRLGAPGPFPCQNLVTERLLETTKALKPLMYQGFRASAKSGGGGI